MLLCQTPATPATPYANNGLNQVTSMGGTVIGYDADQNLITGLSSPGSSPVAKTYGYKARDQLASTSGGTGETYAYDPAGMLYAIGSSNVTRFLYDGAQAIGEYDAGALVTRYVLGATSRTWLLQDEANPSSPWPTTRRARQD